MLKVLVRSELVILWKGKDMSMKQRKKLKDLTLQWKKIITYLFPKIMMVKK